MHVAGLTEMAVIPQVCPLYFETLRKHPEVNDTLKEFIVFKMKNPLSSFGHSDYPFRHGGLKGYGHAKLTRDISIVYSISGTDPKTLKLYGVLTHSDLGTGTPPNLNKQKSIAKRFSNQEFTPFG